MNQLIRMLAAVVLTAFIFTGCVEDTCDEAIGCLNGGTCIDGKCECPEGFEGDDCETEIDLCEDVSCPEGQTCEEGVCACPEGFEGENCDFLSTSKFIGNWGAEDDCPSAGEGYIYSYNALINPITGQQTNVEIINFGDFGDSFGWTAEVSGDTIKVPLGEAGDFRAEGMGIMTESRDSINWVYNVTQISNGAEEECVGVWVRRP